MKHDVSSKGQITSRKMYVIHVILKSHVYFVIFRGFIESNDLSPILQFCSDLSVIFNDFSVIFQCVFSDFT